MRVVGALFGFLFGLPFAIVGLFVASDTFFPMVLDWRETQAWVSADAKIISLKGANNYTQAEYEYNYQGRSYTSDRVYLATFNDNIGSYHGQLYSKLNRIRSNNQNIQIWVNPVNPHDAIIDRGMRWGLFSLVLIFSGIFFCIGLFICYFSLTYKASDAAKNKRETNKLRRRWNRDAGRAHGSHSKQTFSEFVAIKKPELSSYLQENNNDWQKRKGWESKRIRSGALNGVIVLLVFTAILVGVSIIVVKNVPDIFTKFDKENIAGFILFLVTTLLVLQTIKITLRYRRFGRVEFVMDPYPGSIGGNVGGYIDVKRLPFSELNPHQSQFKISLECIYTYMSGSGEDRSRSESIKWAEEGMAEVQRSSSGVMLSFKFDIPGHLPEASVEQSGDYYFWRLKVNGDLPGFDLKRDYNIPVYIGDSQSQNIRNDISEQSREIKQEASEEQARAVQEGNFHLTDLKKVVDIEQVGSEVSMYFPMFRNKVLTVFALVFAGGFGFATFSISSEFGGGIGGIFMMLFSIPFVLVALVAAIASIYLPLNNLTVNLNPGEIRVVRRVLFFPVSSKTIPTHTVSNLKLKRSGSTGQGVKQIVHFKIIAETGSEGITIAEDINGEDLAGHFKVYLAKSMNLQTFND